MGNCFQEKMKKTLLILFLVAGIISCAKDQEKPLILPVAAEPSAKMHNDSGISHYQSGRYKDALLRFMQAYAADKTAGEIYFNIALAYHQRGEPEKALEYFKSARKYANGNDEILASKLLATYLKREK
jgi:tetratricopeptide (TPR) repeat protein